MDRQHTGGEVQRLGGVGSVQAPGDELVAPGSPGLGGAGSGAAQWGAGPLASGSRAPPARAAGTGPEGRLSERPAHQLASARKACFLSVLAQAAVWLRELRVS